MLALLGDALEVAPTTTVLTNGILIDEAMVDGLAALARRASYSLEETAASMPAPSSRGGRERG
jgi:hypothetical protein